MASLAKGYVIPRLDSQHGKPLTVHGAHVRALGGAAARDNEQGSCPPSFGSSDDTQKLSGFVIRKQYALIYSNAVFIANSSITITLTVSD